MLLATAIHFLNDNLLKISLLRFLIHSFQLCSIRTSGASMMQLSSTLRAFRILHILAGKHSISNRSVAISSGVLMHRKTILSSLLFIAFAVPASAQLSPAADFAVHLANQYQIASNVTYRSVSNQAVKLDVYYRRGATTPQPTLVFMHGGFWVAGSKDTMLPSLLPWMEMGWNVVNVEYRLGPASLAPAALEDCLCALKWVAAAPQVQMYHFDTNRLVVSGESAGGHLSLSLGIIPDSAGFAKECPGSTPRVAAVVNWFGITDVADVIDGPNRQNAPVGWFGDMPKQNGGRQTRLATHLCACGLAANTDRAWRFRYDSALMRKR
jgi:acetyl esterase/lipase